MRRAREDVAGLSLDAATARLGAYVLTSPSTLSRLESLEVVPVVRTQRARAYLACLIYGVDPGELALDEGDLPPGIARALRGVSRRRLSHPVTGRYAEIPWWGDVA